MPDDDSKLIIDDDWKSEAAAEKERLADAVEESSAQQGMPAADFTGLVQLLAMQTMVGLGGMRGPGGNDIPPNIELAKHHIDLLDVLEKKTAGNLEPEEKKMFDTTLHQLRMAYVEVVQAGATPPSGM